MRVVMVPTHYLRWHHRLSWLWQTVSDNNFGMMTTLGFQRMSAFYWNNHHCAVKWLTGKCWGSKYQTFFNNSLSWGNDIWHMRNIHFSKHILHNGFNSLHAESLCRNTHLYLNFISLLHTKFAPIVNPCRAAYIFWNLNIYFLFLSFLSTNIVQAMNIIPVYPAYIKSWILMPWEQICENLDQKLYIFIQENAFENVVWKMTAILSWPQCVKILLNP